MGIVLAVQLVPIALLGIPSGSLVARLGARRTMQLADIVRAPLMCSLPLLHAAGAHVPAPPGDRLPDRLHRAVLRLAARDPAGGSSARTRTTVAQANAVIEGETTTNPLGPLAAGVLIATLRANERALRRRGDLLVSFLVLTFFVPARPPLPQTEGSHGLLAGLRFRLRDELLWRIGLAAVFLNMFGSAPPLPCPCSHSRSWRELTRRRGALRLARRGARSWEWCSPCG